MKSLASLSLILLIAAQEPPPGDGPRGSSQRAAGEARYDAVGEATVRDAPGISIASRDLPPGSYAEVTALDSGRTIVVGVVGDDAPMTGVALMSRGAAAALGLIGERAAVRVRRVTPTPQDIVQLRDGGAAPTRADAPPALLVALRKQLVPTTVAVRSAPKPRPATAKPPLKPAALPSASVTSGYVIQVAALSSTARAAIVARAVGGTVIPGPPVWRVRLGPYPDADAAARARAEAARRGYPGGQITRLR